MQPALEPISRSTCVEALTRFVSDEILAGEETVAEDTPLLEWGVIDSLSMMSLLTFIDQEMGIQVPDEEVRPEYFASVGQLADLLVTLRGSAPEATPWERVVEGLAHQGLKSRALAAAGRELRLLESEGQGPTWLLIPGPGQPAVAWTPFMRARLGQQAMVAVELPDNADGEASPELRLERWREALCAVADDLRGRPLVVVAAGLAAPLATELARERPEQVSALVLVSAGEAGESPALWERQRGPEAVPYLDRASFSAPDLSVALRACLDAGTEGPSFGAALSAIGPSALAGAFEGFEQPTCFVAGEADPFLSVAQVEAAAGRLEHARLERLPRCGHLIHLERPQELLHLVERFLGALPTA